MKKNKKKIIFFVIILLLIIFIIIFGKSSYSKYLMQIEGTGVIDVAKWAFLVNGKTGSITNINLANTYNKETLSQNTIAPGTSGSFTIVVDTTGSDVGINYYVTFKNEQNKPQNLKFTYDGHTKDSIKDLEEYLIGTINANDEEKVKEMLIEWNWPYETGTTDDVIKLEDIEDTNDGKLLSKYSFDVVVTGIQVEPEN